MNRYRQGYLAELELVKELKAKPEFHTVLRSAGSRSSFDVVAIGESGILLCQVKTGKGAFKAEKERLERLKVPANVSKQVRAYRNGSWRVWNVK